MRALVLIVLVAGAGCAGRLVGDPGFANERKATAGQGGVIGISGNREKALAQARPWMAERCGGAYRIVSEEQVQTGTNPRAWAGGSHPTETQITYTCGAAPSAAR